MLTQIDLAVTFCGAHSVPRGSTEKEAADDVIEHQLPCVTAVAEHARMPHENYNNAAMLELASSTFLYC